MKKYIILLIFFLLTCCCVGCISGETKQSGNVNINKILSTSIKTQYQVDMRSKKETNTADMYKAVDKISAVGVNEDKIYGYRMGDVFLNKYRFDFNVNQIILVEQKETIRNEGVLFFLIRQKDGFWIENLTCKAYLGKNGINKEKEGDGKTPSGDFGVILAFGIKGNPGSLIEYTQVTDSMFLCSDRDYYNKLIDISKIKHRCSNVSEHLSEYAPQYNYALFLDYNKECVYGKGSAIFMHCYGSFPYTLGCISISEDNMVYLLRRIDKNVRVCIYPYKG